MLKGIDISHWQQGIDLSKIECDFVIVKATEGVNHIDPCFNDFYKKIKKLGKKFGFYHFAKAAEKDAKVEAQFFYDQTKECFKHGIPILDWEVENIKNVKWAKAWLDEVYRLSSVKPIIYMSQSTVNSYNWSAVADAGYALWVAKYKDNNISKNYDMSKAGEKPIVKWWKTLALWQWTSKGRLDGYKSDLDCDIFYGTAAAWDAYIKKSNVKKTVVTDRLAKYTDSQLADKVINGEFGNGAARKKALGKRFDAVQKIVDKKLSTKKEVYHTIVKGDTLIKLAAKYKTTVLAIMQLNKIKNANKIIIGQKIRVK